MLRPCVNVRNLWTAWANLVFLEKTSSHTLHMLFEAERRFFGVVSLCGWPRALNSMGRSCFSFLGKMSPPTLHMLFGAKRRCFG